MNTETTEQGAQPSVNERIENLFAPKAPKAAPAAKEEPEAAAPEQTEETSAGESDTPATAEELFELEVDGERYALPKKLEKAVMQERDYTQKSQVNAQMRKQLEFQQEQLRIVTSRQDFEKSVSQELQRLNAYDQVLAEKVDLNSLTPDQLNLRIAQHQQWKQERDEIERTLQAKHQQWVSKQKETVDGLKAKAAELASQFIPNWSEATQKQVLDHALSDGYTQAELDQAGLDPRHWKTLWKAQQFDLLKSRAAKTVSDVKSIKTTSSKPMPNEVKEKLAFRKQVSKLPQGSPEQKALVRDRIAKIFG